MEDAASPHIATTRRILLVEDDATVAATIAGLLEAQGHRFVGRAWAGGARRTRRRDYAAALLDLDLTGVDGLTSRA